MEKEIAFEKFNEVENNVKDFVTRCFRYTGWQIDTVDVGRFGATIYLSLKKYPSKNLELIYYAESKHTEEKFTTNIAAMGSFDVIEEGESMAYYKAVGKLLLCKKMLNEIRILLSKATKQIYDIEVKYRENC